MSTTERPQQDITDEIRGQNPHFSDEDISEEGNNILTIEPGKNLIFSTARPKEPEVFKIMDLLLAGEYLPNSGGENTQRLSRILEELAIERDEDIIFLYHFGPIRPVDELTKVRAAKRGALVNLIDRFPVALKAMEPAEAANCLLVYHLAKFETEHAIPDDPPLKSRFEFVFPYKSFPLPDHPKGAKWPQGRTTCQAVDDIAGRGLETTAREHHPIAPVVISAVEWKELERHGETRRYQLVDRMDIELHEEYRGGQFHGRHEHRADNTYIYDWRLVFPRQKAQEDPFYREILQTFSQAIDQINFPMGIFEQDTQIALHLNPAFNGIPNKEWKSN